MKNSIVASAPAVVARWATSSTIFGNGPDGLDFVLLPVAENELAKLWLPFHFATAVKSLPLSASILAFDAVYL